MFQEQVELPAKIRKPGNLKLQTPNYTLRFPTRNLMLKVSHNSFLTNKLSNWKATDPSDITISLLKITSPVFASIVKENFYSKSRKLAKVTLPWRGKQLG